MPQESPEGFINHQELPCPPLATKAPKAVIPAHAGIHLDLEQSQMDSRFRGNDDRESGNDDRESGNDDRESRSDDRESGSDDRECGNDGKEGRDPEFFEAAIVDNGDVDARVRGTCNSEVEHQQ